MNPFLENSPEKEVPSAKVSFPFIACLQNSSHGHCTSLTLVSDPLMSFYSGSEGVAGIEDLPIYVTRCSPEGDNNTLLQLGFNSYLNDRGVPVSERVRTEMHLDTKTNFSFDHGYAYLVCVT